MTAKKACTLRTACCNSTVGGSSVPYSFRLMAALRGSKMLSPSSRLTRSTGRCAYHQAMGAVRSTKRRSRMMPTSVIADSG